MKNQTTTTNGTNGAIINGAANQTETKKTNVSVALSELMKRAAAMAAKPSKKQAQHECACGCKRLTKSTWYPGDDGITMSFAVKTTREGATQGLAAEELSAYVAKKMEEYHEAGGALSVAR